MTHRFERILGILLLVIFLGIFGNPQFTEAKSDVDTMKIHVFLPGGEEKVLTLWNDDQGVLYAALPVGIDRNQAYLEFEGAAFLDGQALENGQSLSSIQLDRTYELMEKNQNGSMSQSLIFKQTSAIANLFISADSADFVRICQSKEEKAVITMDLFTPEGKLDYRSEGEDSLKLRGNSTAKLDKKPFALTLDGKKSLLGMPEAKKWVLLANGFDETGVRNYLAFDLAQNTQIQWVPAHEYVNLYVNGEFQGLYLLTEKIDLYPETSPSGGTEGFLMEISQDAKVGGEDIFVTTDHDRVVEIKYPKEPDLEFITSKINELETSIYDSDWEHFLEMIDLESWAYRFLVDEICANMDMDASSSYYFYDAEEKRFYAGPVWDYDLSMGSMYSSKKGYWNLGPRTLRKNETYWFKRIYDCEIFREAVEEVFEVKFLPQMQNLVQGGLQELADQIRDSSKLNTLRWNQLYSLRRWEDMQNFEEGIAYLQDYLETRTTFLSGLWLEKAEYHRLNITLGERKYITYVKAGESPMDAFTKYQRKDLEGIQNFYDPTTGEAVELPDHLEIATDLNAE